MKQKPSVTDSGLKPILDELRARPVSPDTVALRAAVEEVMGSLGGELSLADLTLYRELEGLATFIKTARAEIASVRPDRIKLQDIPAATDELEAVVGATETATGTILEAAEELEKMGDELGGTTQERISDIVTRVYEACGFQDITGQRITKVVKTLQQIEERLDSILSAFGEDYSKLESEAPPASDPNKKPTDQDLLHGPQMPDEAKRQAEIDAILASFG
ncbi:protein phosphatase CheZ [Lacibacterium aquatile]|uniref:Protein phosphatase CheZ n=1 Tax=Lacibacterium aquatile TaxID=1168082 RepID=A0ABW5DPC6_9PROT